MTEQRIIRIEFGSKNEIQFIGSVWYEDTEPAPPKGWRPICYDSQYNKLNGCDPATPVVKTCQQCPFLADRHRINIEGDHNKNENDEKVVTPSPNEE